MVQKKMFILAIVVSIGFNFDFFNITSTLISDKSLSAQIAATAEKQQIIKADTITNNQQLDEAVNKRQQLLDSLYKKNAPIGWQTVPKNKMNFHSWWFWLMKLFGWIICAAALSFGAPFWFDLLSKIVNLRKAGIKPLN